MLTAQVKNNYSALSACQFGHAQTLRDVGVYLRFGEAFTVRDLGACHASMQAVFGDLWTQAAYEPEHCFLDELGRECRCPLDAEFTLPVFRPVRPATRADGGGA